jgi:hypothetical protein
MGAAAQAEAAVAPVKKFGSPVLDTVGSISYSALNSMLDAAFPKGALNYWKSHFVDTLTDDAIDALIEAFAECPTPMGQLMLEHFHGAATRVPVGETAYALRSEGYNAAVITEWLDPALTERCIGWARRAYGSLLPFAGRQRYINYLDEDDTTAGGSLAAVYGPNLPRLREIKKRYDPDNFFRMNLNIPPA